MRDVRREPSQSAYLDIYDGYVIKGMHVHLDLLLDNRGLETLGGSDEDWLDVSEEWVLGVLLLVPASGDAESESALDALDAALPDGLVELWGETHVGGAHVHAGELLDLLDGSWRSLLEGDAVQPLVHVDGVLAGNNVL